jgi:flagellar FliL protein
MPRIVENLKAYMREIPDEDLRGSAGLLRLRERFLVRVNAAATPVQVKDVLFQEILFQR